MRGAECLSLAEVVPVAVYDFFVYAITSFQRSILLPRDQLTIQHVST